jgi:hypothetical protein
MSANINKPIHRWHYADEIATFLGKSPATVLGEIVSAFPFAIEQTQRYAWSVQIEQLQQTLQPYAGRGKVYFEYDVPRMGKRIDVLLLIHRRIQGRRDRVPGAGHRPGLGLCAGPQELPRKQPRQDAGADPGFDPGDQQHGGARNRAVP